MYHSLIQSIEFMKFYFKTLTANPNSDSPDLVILEIRYKNLKTS